MKRNWCLVAVDLALIGGLWMFVNDTALIQAALGLKPAAALAATKESHLFTSGRPHGGRSRVL